MSNPTVFISYSHEDTEWKDRLETHLKVLELEDYLEVWSDRETEPGEPWQEKIEHAMERAHLSILLISADFLTSTFIRENEIPYLLERQKNGEVHILPIIIKPCAWQEVPWLARMQVYPHDGRAIAGLSRSQVDQQLAEIAIKAKKIIGVPLPSLPFFASSEDIIDSPNPLFVGQRSREELGIIYDKLNTIPIKLAHLRSAPSETKVEEILNSVESQIETAYELARQILYPPSILVITDSIENGQEVTTYLEKQRYEVILETTKAGAVREVARSHVGLILFYLVRHEILDGLQLAQQIRLSEPQKSIVFLADKIYRSRNARKINDLKLGGWIDTPVTHKKLETLLALIAKEMKDA